MSKKFGAFLLSGLLIGFLLFAGIRVALVKITDVHYHANFALFVNGTRDKFDNFNYYEEIATCSSSEVDNPKHSVHMHNKVSDLVHVHAHAATWGAFFANISYTLGNKVLVTDNGVYVDGQDGKKLQFLLNGKPVQTAEDRVIQSEDALLISYGDEDATGLQTQYNQIARTAAAENKEQDPAACSGTGKLTLKDRFRQAFNFTN